MKKVPLAHYLMAMVLAAPLVIITEPWIRTELFPDTHFASEEDYTRFKSRALYAAAVLAFFSSLAVVNLITGWAARRKVGYVRGSL